MVDAEFLNDLGISNLEYSYTLVGSFLLLNEIQLLQGSILNKLFRIDKTEIVSIYF